MPLLTNLALLLGLSLFFGLAFEEFEPHQGRTQPGGVRTFPLLALAGAMLYLLDETHLIPVSVGVLVLGAWLHAYYRSAVAERDAEGVPNVGLTVPVCNLLAYLLGPITLTQPHWVAVGLTVTAVLLLTGRERLHTMARQLELPEIVTAGKVSHPNRYYPSAAPERADNPADESHALSGVARLGSGVHAVLRELPAAAILNVEPKCIRDRNPRRSLFVNSDHRGTGTPCQHR